MAWREVTNYDEGRLWDAFRSDYNIDVTSFDTQQSLTEFMTKQFEDAAANGDPLGRLFGGNSKGIGVSLVIQEALREWEDKQGYIEKPPSEGPIERPAEAPPQYEEYEEEYETPEGERRIKRYKREVISDRAVTEPLSVTVIPEVVPMAGITGVPEIVAPPSEVTAVPIVETPSQRVSRTIVDITRGISQRASWSNVSSTVQGVSSRISDTINDMTNWIRDRVRGK